VIQELDIKHLCQLFPTLLSINERLRQRCLPLPW
jgi:hypothetical protein